jgi:hypothetical protein
MAKKLPETVYQLNISIYGSKPKIWRRFLVTDDVSLKKLHDIIQVVMGWESYHLHGFEIDGRDFGEPDPDFDFRPVTSERRIKLGELGLAVGETFEYTYDYGDNWEHRIKVEKILPFDPAAKYPICVAGKRACPPEDCGGIWNYNDLRRLKSVPADELSDWEKEQLEWYGDYDSEYFSVDETNEFLWKMLRIK